MTPQHTQGLGCRLAPVPWPAEADPSIHDIPPLAAQFFYSSLVPIDDPLAVAAAPDARPSKGPQLPFSPGDSNALEKAWLSFASEEHRRAHSGALRNRSPSPSAARSAARKLATLCHQLARKHRLKHEKEGVSIPAAIATASAGPACCAELRVDASNELRKTFCAVVRRRQQNLDEDSVVETVMAQLSHVEALPLHLGLGLGKGLRSKSSSVSSAKAPTRSATGGISALPAADDGISGMPFVRVGTPDRAAQSLTPVFGSLREAADTSAQAAVDSSLHKGERGGDGRGEGHGRDTPLGSEPEAEAEPEIDPEAEMTAGPETDEAGPYEPPSLPVDVPVGVSRLHMVSLPVLQMRPIYWSPINDVTVVLRATWFYRDTMTPVEPGVANQLEAGYRELRPWSETWSDEVRCAVEVGALGEEKVAHPLWPKPVHPEPQQQQKQYQQNQQYPSGGPSGGPSGSTGSQTKDPMASEPLLSSDPFCAARCFRGGAAAEGTLDAVGSGGVDGQELPAKSFANHCVVYRDAREAFLLKPSLKPSAYYGRKPISKIVRGTTVGVPLVRGFDREAWDRIHKQGNSAAPRHQGTGLDVAAASESAPALSSSPAAAIDRRRGRHRPSQPSLGTAHCVACWMEAERWRVTDLVLVAHGIGQKFAERVESFHFTHAINAFRRTVNIELGTDLVGRGVAWGSGGSSGNGGRNPIMVLPVNWRHVLSFEDGGLLTEAGDKTTTADGFNLKDIEPNTIPAIRSMISDVMFDVPFYMSKHKPKMILALVREANRVYRLWCRNNPDFAEGGRVHLMAHSLGSVMAMEVLSNQPTVVPRLEYLDQGGSDHAGPRVGAENPGQARGEGEGEGDGEEGSEGNRNGDLLADIGTGRRGRGPHFDFDTTNLFMLGSPAGFFLLLERGQLVPRRGRMKPGADPADVAAADVVGDQGRFGCLAVDNIYNILAKEDPIAYLLNGTIDPLYASSLRMALVPSTATSFFQSIGDSIRGLWPGGGGGGGGGAIGTNGNGGYGPIPGSDAASGQTGLARPSTLRLPSQLELEVHDFTREETAERKAYLLNDNGQIDFYLRSGGGPLEMQYLNMLSAHSSYWTSRDFIRMLCMEIRRKPGRANTYPNLRAVKATKRLPVAKNTH